MSEEEVEENKMMVIKTHTEEQLQQALAIRGLIRDCVIVPEAFGSAFVSTQRQDNGVKMFPDDTYNSVVVVILYDEHDNELCRIPCGDDVEEAWEIAYAIAKEAGKEVESAVDGEIFIGEARK